jgi:hypothetical protein
MSRLWVLRLAVMGVAFAVGFSVAYGVFKAASYRPPEPNNGESMATGDRTATRAELPDPLAPRSTPTRSLVLVAFLLAVSVGVLWLGRRRAREPLEEIQEEPLGPRLIVTGHSQGRNRSPEFYEDLRRRETKLESLEVKGPERQRRKVIELPIGDRDSRPRDRKSIR